MRRLLAHIGGFPGRLTFVALGPGENWHSQGLTMAAATCIKVGQLPGTGRIVTLHSLSSMHAWLIFDLLYFLVVFARHGSGNSCEAWNPDASNYCNPRLQTTCCSFGGGNEAGGAVCSYYSDQGEALWSSWAKPGYGSCAGVSIAALFKHVLGFIAAVDSWFRPEASTGVHRADRHDQGDCRGSCPSGRTGPCCCSGPNTGCIRASAADKILRQVRGDSRFGEVSYEEWWAFQNVFEMSRE